MKNKILIIITFLVCFFGAKPTVSAAPFTAGNLVIYRVGDGTQTLANTGNSVYLDEYTPAGVFVQSISMPTTVTGSNQPLVASGTAASEGLISRSADGHYIVLCGYGTTIPYASSLTSTASATVNRVVGLVDASGTVNTTTALTDASTGNNPRSVASSDGTKFWITGGTGGARYFTLGGTTSTQISTTVVNLRQINIFDGQLYISTGATSYRLCSVGTGMPETSGQTITNLSGLPVTGSQYAFFMADLDATEAGMDVLYIADDGTGVGILKYSKVAGSWIANGTITAAAIRGLTGVVSGTSVTLYGTTGSTSSTSSGSMYVYTDNSGYTTTTSTSVLGAVTTVASAATNTAFRGIALAPVLPLTAPSLTASATATVKASFEVTFTDDATWRTGITSITFDGTIVPSAAYSLTTAGKIVFDPSLSAGVLTAKSANLVFKSTGYADATLAQAIGTGTTNPVDPSLFSVTTENSITNYLLNLLYTANAANDQVLVAINTTNTFGTLTDGSSYDANVAIAGGGTSLGYHLGAFQVTGLDPFKTYYFKMWSVNADKYYSTGLTANGTTLKGIPAAHITDFAKGSVSSSSIQVNWTDATDADGYLVIASTSSISDPVNGVAQTDAALVKNILPGVKTCLFSGLSDGNSYTVKIYPYNNSGVNIKYKLDETVPELVVKTPKTPLIIMNEDFESGSLGVVTPYSVAGESQVWVYGTSSTLKYAKMSGYSGSAYVANEDWLISPSFNLNNYSSELLSFSTARNYGTAGQQPLVLKYSTNYNGTSAPSEATWVDLAIPTLSAGSWVFTSSGDIDVSAITGSNVHFAIIYSNGTTSATTPTWEVDDIKLTGYSSADTVVSSQYIVNNTANSINGVVYNTALASFKSNITAAQYATTEVYQADGVTVATDLQNGYKLYVVAQDGSARTYVITVNGANAATFSVVDHTGRFTNMKLTCSSDNVSNTMDASGNTWSYTFGNIAAGSYTWYAVGDSGSSTSVQLINPAQSVTIASGSISGNSYTVQSSQKAISAFSFASLSPAVSATISGNTITATVPHSTNLSGLVATFTASQYASVKVSSVEQVSGTTANDFTSSLNYVVTAEDGTTVTYAVTITRASLTRIRQIQYSSNGDSPLKGQTITTGGVVTAINSDKSGFFLQDSSKTWNGVYVYVSTTASKVAVGDSIEFDATVAEYYYLTELKSPTGLSIIASGKKARVPVEVTPATITEAVEGVLVHIDSLKCIKVDADGKSNAAFFYKSNTTDTVFVHNQLYASFVPTLDSVYSITGVLNYTYSHFKIEPRSADDCVKQTVFAKPVVIPAMSVSISEITLPANDTAFTIAITSNVDWTVKGSASWISYNPASGNGNATVTATVAANTTGNPRINVITVSGTSVDNQTISATQKKKTATATYSAVASECVIYPNPVRNVLYIKNALNGSRIHMINALGADVKSIQAIDDITSVDISTLAPGAYFVSVTAANGQSHVYSVIKK